MVCSKTIGFGVTSFYAHQRHVRQVQWGQKGSKWGPDFITMIPIAAAAMMVVLSSFARIPLSQDKQKGNTEKLDLKSVRRAA
jgi:hypothetical protein